MNRNVSSKCRLFTIIFECKYKHVLIKYYIFECFIFSLFFFLSSNGLSFGIFLLIKHNYELQCPIWRSVHNWLFRSNIRYSSTYFLNKFIWINSTYIRHTIYVA
ncbi:hypothetical protein FF38_05509 [Lucilia cuprina]|uniref:Uncharacterized protein n=1 Tax=Lucilia cuprina TaxID=7375 RepID=A0A0L0CC53_LUCCU|nr:hypothetical protein FF38_05509 [Lucilia cuprina]